MRDIKRLHQFNVVIRRRFFVDSLAEQRLRQAYLLLDLDETATVEEARARYSKLVRQLHPDTGGEKADPDRLEKVRSAYKLIVKSDENAVKERVEEEEKDFGIRHVVPQHRQYLEYGGVGSGNPFTRHRQYQQNRVYNALESVREFTVEKGIRESQDSNNMGLIAVNEQKKREKNRLTGMLDRVVEDMILSSMGAGEFSNLKGAGQPLKMNQSNPYIDQTQQTINRILRDNGFSFAPPWIVKEKELRTSITEYRQRLCNKLAYEIALQLNTGPFDESNFLSNIDDEQILSSLENDQFMHTELKEINRLVQNYNLIAPSMDRQFMPLRKDLELKRAKNEVLNDFPHSHHTIDARQRIEQEMSRKRKQNESSKGFLQNLLNRFY